MRDDEKIDLTNLKVRSGEFDLSEICSFCRQPMGVDPDNCLGTGLPHELPKDKESQVNAFVAGARWWEFESTGGTMWASARAKAWKAARDKYK